MQYDLLFASGYCLELSCYRLVYILMRKTGWIYQHNYRFELTTMCFDDHVLSTLMKRSLDFYHVRFPRKQETTTS